jgi:hypothetical protein
MPVRGEWPANGVAKGNIAGGKEVAVRAECGYAAVALAYTDIITEVSVKVGAPATAAHRNGQKPPPIS